jgi:hypothetical protein
VSNFKTACKTLSSINLVTLQEKNGEGLSIPLRTLNKEWQASVQALQTVMQAPLEICFAALFSSINHAVQSLVNIKLPQGQVKPVSCFFISIADSGERKTSADDIALKATAQYQQVMLKKYAEQKKGYRDKKGVYDEEKKSFFQDKGFKKLSPQEKRDRLNQLHEPEAPRYPILVTSDPTMEGLIKLFYDGFPFVMLSTSEGGEFFGSHANNKENHLKTLARLSRLWDGAPVEQVRKDSELLFLKDQRLNLHISVQPSVFKSFMERGIAEGQGFISRILLSSPKPLAGTRPWIEPEHAEHSLKTLDVFYKRVLSLYERIEFNKADPTGESLAGDPSSGLKLKEMTWSSSKSRAILKKFYEYGESRLSLGGIFHEVKDFVSKSQENVLRIAATLTLYKNPETTEITLENIHIAIDLVNFYISEHLYLRKNSRASDEEKLLTWLYAKYPDGVFERAALMRGGPYEFRKTPVLDPLLERLAKLRYIKSLGKGIFCLVDLPSIVKKE